jgi:hypothetical protein
MTDIVALIVSFLESYLLEILILIVGWALISELFSGKVRARYGRIFTRRDNPFRYWFWILFQAIALVGLIAAWWIGFDFDF